MKIQDMISYLQSLTDWSVEENNTCDRLKVGNKEMEITKIGVSMFATPDVVREAKRQGINFLIVHEPLCYTHFDDVEISPIGAEKRRFIEEQGIAVFRFHDYAHHMVPDLIYDGQIASMGLAGTREEGTYYAVNRYRLTEPMTAKELAKHLEKVWNIRHIKIAGCTDKKGSYLSCCFGTPGHVPEELAVTDFVLTGEIYEFEAGEIARDYAQLGYNKALLVLGHIGSEKEGMRLLSERLSEAFPDLSTTYIECGEVYSYTD